MLRTIIFSNRLVKVMNKVTDFCFDETEYKYIVLTKLGTTQASLLGIYSVLFDKKDFSFQNVHI